METKSRKMKFTDLKDMLNQTGEVYGDRPAYIFKTEEKGKFRTITHKEFRENINALGTTLIQMGLKDKRIALISENRYEWELSYLAVASGVGVIVPLDKALPDNELESLILRSQVEAIIYSSKYDAIMKTLREKKNTNLKYFISMDLEENTQGIYAEKALVEKGKKLLADGNKTYIDAKIGVTKQKQWIRINEKIELLDTPGVLWPKFESQKVAMNLAITGTIKDDILDLVEVAYTLTKFMLENYKENLLQRYSLEEKKIDEILQQDQAENENIYEIMQLIGRRRGAILGGNIDDERTAKLILDDFRSGKLGKITLEIPE